MSTPKEQWFSYDPNDRFIFHDTEDKARSAASNALDYYRCGSSDEGWNDNVTKVCWGKVSQRVEQTSLKHRPPPEEIDDDGYGKDETDWDHSFDEIAEYELRPEKPMNPTLPCSTPCPKCGSVDILRHHRLPGQTWRMHENQGYSHESEYTKECWFDGHCLKGCITNTCRTCHYRFDIPTL